MQSLFLAAIGDARDRGAKALETFAYRYREGESQYERFQVHKTIFPSDFLADFGFRTLRAAGFVELARLELGGLLPVTEGRREKALRVMKEAFDPGRCLDRRLAGRRPAEAGLLFESDRRAPTSTATSSTTSPPAARSSRASYRRCC